MSSVGDLSHDQANVFLWTKSWQSESTFLQLHLSTALPIVANNRCDRNIPFTSIIIDSIMLLPQSVFVAGLPSPLPKMLHARLCVSIAILRTPGVCGYYSQSIRQALLWLQNS
jgi:hypothetical protein